MGHTESRRLVSRLSDVPYHALLLMPTQSDMPGQLTPDQATATYRLMPDLFNSTYQSRSARRA